MQKLNEEKCVGELKELGYEISSFEIVKKEDNKLIANMVFVYNEASVPACFKMYNTSKFEQIERVYTILQLLKTKLDDGAKKEKVSFVNLLPEVYKIWRKDDVFYVIEEMIEGESLADYACNNKIQDFDEFVKITKQLCDAVAMIHKPFPPIVHCDIKETNIVIDKNDQVVKIIDFDASYIEGSSAYNIVRSTKGYRPTEMVNSAPVSQSDIYAIGCIIEKLFENSNWKKKLDSQCNEKLRQIIIKSKEDLSRRYYKIEELKADLSEVEILYMLQRQMNELDDSDAFNVYSYANDRDGKIADMQEQISDYVDSNILYVADRGEQRLAFTMESIYCKGDIVDDGKAKSKSTDVIAIPYNELVACVKKPTVPPSGKDILICITKTTAGQWKRYEMKLPTDATDLVMGVLNNIVLFKNSYYSDERIADYYSNKCHEVNDILSRKELDGKQSELESWWNFVIDLGNLACETEEVCGKKNYSCSDILLKVYENKRKALKHSNGNYEEIMDCFENEIKHGSETAEKKKQKFEQDYKEKQLEAQDKGAKKIGDLVNKLVQKKEDE